MDDRRTSPRFALGLACTIRGRGGVMRPAHLIDISQSGCRVEGTTRLHTQDLVWLTIGPVRSVSGTVAWASPDFAGIAFANDLHDSVLDHLVARAGSQSGKQQALHELAFRSERLAHWSISQHEADSLFDLAEACRRD